MFVIDIMITTCEHHHISIHYVLVRTYYSNVTGISASLKYITITTTTRCSYYLNSITLNIYK